MAGEFFDASSGETPRSADEVLASLQSQDAERQLRGALDGLRDLLDTWREEEAEKPVDPEVVEALDAVTGAADAPLSYRSLHRRVHAGRTTWETFWRDPQAEEDGPLIVNAVVKHNTARLNAVLADIDEHAEEQTELGRELDAEVARQAGERDRRRQDRQDD